MGPPLAVLSQAVWSPGRANTVASRRIILEETFAAQNGTSALPPKADTEMPQVGWQRFTWARCPKALTASPINFTSSRKEAGFPGFRLSGI